MRSIHTRWGVSAGAHPEGGALYRTAHFDGSEWTEVASTLGEGMSLGGFAVDSSGGLWLSAIDLATRVARVFVLHADGTEEDYGSAFDPAPSISHAPTVHSGGDGVVVVAADGYDLRAYSLSEAGVFEALPDRPGALAMPVLVAARDDVYFYDGDDSSLWRYHGGTYTVLPITARWPLAWAVAEDDVWFLDQVYGVFAGIRGDGVSWRSFTLTGVPEEVAGGLPLAVSAGSGGEYRILAAPYGPSVGPPLALDTLIVDDAQAVVGYRRLYEEGCGASSRNACTEGWPLVMGRLRDGTVVVLASGVTANEERLFMLVQP